jgi:predicted transcriptional regulator
MWYIFSMDFLTDSLALLGLRKKEIRVFMALYTHGELSMSRIARKSNLPRSTAVSIVERLLSQGIIQERKGGDEKGEKRSVYFLDLIILAKKIEHLTQKLYKGIHTLSAEKKLEEEKEQGKTYFPIIERHKGERVQILLSQSGECGREKAQERGFSYIKKCQKEGVKGVCITCPITADALEKKMREEVSNQKEFLRIHRVPFTYCTASYDVIVFHNEALLISLYTSEILYENTEGVVDILQHLLRITRAIGWSVRV